MTDSWTEDDLELAEVDPEAARSISPSGVAPPTEYDEAAQGPTGHITTGHVTVEDSGEGPRVRIYPSVGAAEYERTHAMREALRTDELEHLDELRSRVQSGMDQGLVSLESGTTMLLNISKARMALGGVAPYGAF